MPQDEPPAPKGVTCSVTIPHAQITQALIDAGAPVQAVVGSAVFAAGIKGGAEFVTESALQIIEILRKGGDEFVHSTEAALAALDAARIWIERHGVS